MFQKSCLQVTLSALLLSSPVLLLADPIGPPSSTKPSTTLIPRKEAPIPGYVPNVKTALPQMTKPFGMPGVIGFQNDKWEGTDFLGYVSNNIGIDVEILKSEKVPNTIDARELESLASQIFSKESINPTAEAKEGPPLPFLHILLTFFPVDRDKYVILGNARLFEQVQVLRKDFIPAGYWQGITWENQDVVLSSGQQLNSQAKALVEKLATAFAKRYRQYNLNREGMPPATQPEIPAQ